MYRKLHIQLTLFCCLVISTILIIVTLISISLVKENQNLQQMNNFQKSMNHIYQTLSEESNISHAWLDKISSDSKIHLSLLDNNIPLLYNNTDSHSSLFMQAQDYAKNNYALSELAVQNSHSTKHAEFELKSSNHKKYLSSVGYIPKNSGILTVIAVYAVTQSPTVFKQVYLPITLSALSAILLLCFGSFLLIRRLIDPLIRNHEQQVNFFSAASHELRSPLAVVIAALPLLKNETSSHNQSTLSMVEKECKRMQRLVNDMFTLAALDNEKISVHYEEAFIDNLLIDCYEKFEVLASKKQINITFHISDQLFPAVFCDPERISQVFTILLDNAISYTPEKGCVQISLKLCEKNILISVADNGPGIPDEYKAEIFNRFYRCDYSRTDKNHFGLGLSIAKEIVDLHHGSISVADSNINGAEFIVKLPLNFKNHFSI